MFHTIIQSQLKTSKWAVRLIGMFSIGTSAFGAAWNRVNAPSMLGPNSSAYFNQLPLQGEIPLSRRPWSETYWPMNRGGIAYRWGQFPWTHPKNVPADPGIFRVHSPTRDEALRMSQQDLALLSPAEKFDLLRGYYNYPLTQSILRRTGPNRAYWEGICDGWSAASLAHPEPAPVVATNADGIRIPFGSSDVKGLLAFYYANYNRRVFQLGVRCNVDLERFPGSASMPACEDVNAGSFHVVLSNFLGLRQTGFVAEVDRGLEVWNNPVFAYQSRILADRMAPDSRSAPGTVYRVEMQTDMLIADDDENFGPQWNPVVGTPQFKQDTMHYHYTLDIDANGQIVGGDWISFERPDYLWTKSPMAFTGEFSALGQIYMPASVRP